MFTVLFVYTQEGIHYADLDHKHIIPGRFGGGEHVVGYAQVAETQY